MEFMLILCYFILTIHVDPMLFYSNRQTFYQMVQSMHIRDRLETKERSLITNCGIVD